MNNKKNTDAVNQILKEIDKMPPIGVVINEETTTKNTLTKETLEEIINKKEFIRIGDKTTICCLTLINGFEVIGTSACVDKKNFKKETGEYFSYQEAFNKLWELEGYKLQSYLFDKK